MAENSDIWVLLEAEEDQLSRQALALLKEGSRLAGEVGGELQAVFIGPQICDLADVAGAYGARTLYLAADERLKLYDPEVYEQILGALLGEKSPWLVLALASSLGSDLLPRLAARLEQTLVTRCADISVQPDGTLRFVKPVHNGRLFATLRSCREGGGLATFLEERLSADAEPPAGGRRAEVVALELPAEPPAGAIRVTGFVKADHRTIDISEAQVIVAVGRGLGEKPNLEMVEAFADQVGGAIGGTRPMVDERILPYERQIGQTGKRVSPRLIFLCGISGAVEFTQGVRNPGASIAINSDPQAPILKSADLGIVGDLKDLLPKIHAHLAEISATPAARVAAEAPAQSKGGQRTC